MMNAATQESLIALLIVTSVLLFLTGLKWFSPYTGLTRQQSVAALLGCAVLCGYRSYDHFHGLHFKLQEQISRMGVRIGVGPYESALCAGAVVFFLAALILRLWGRWIGEKSTAEERQSGVPGVRAWFSTSNVVVGALIVVCAWQGDGISPVLSIVGVGALLAAYPLLRMESNAVAVAQSPVAPQEDLSPEREKIVAMLEAGKLTADESAELLQALGATKQPASAPRAVALTGGQRLMLIGAAIVMVGFFLPWFVINPGSEAGRMMGDMQKSLQSQMGNLPMPEGVQLPQLAFKTSSFSVTGGSIGNGLGWAALLFALAAAVLPYVATQLEAATARMARMLCLAVGTLIILYLLSEGIRYAGVGLIAAAVGYGLEIAGMVRDRRAVSA
jgi:hypothetical protein